MKTLGEEIFARDGEGRLLSRIGTLFFRTPGLVTQRGIHAMQRLMWIGELNRERAERGLAPLTEAEEEAELSESADLIFTDDCVLIRPDPERMDLAIRADAVLQTLVSKRQIRFLNTHSGKVRNALCARGENWRMARHPISQEDMVDLIGRSRVAIRNAAVYYYNGATGTRYLTVGACDEIAALGDEAFRAQVQEIVESLSRRNRLGQPEVDLFPSTTPIEVRVELKGLRLAESTAAELRAAFARVATAWRMSLPAELRVESVENFDWRNALCQAILRQPNETSAAEQELASGIAPEFYRQIEWLPGARIDRGEVIFDELYEEAAKTRDPELLALCDNRVKSLIFNIMRLFGSLVFVNVGRIARSLARRPVAGNRRGNVYIVQYLTEGAGRPKMMLMRLQKWGVAERLDEGKDLLTAMVESDEYTDYILDRRLMCRQLGMRLPPGIGCGHFTETYRGGNRYAGTAVRTPYFVRPYVDGLASDKVPPPRFRNPAWALAFARLMGAAAAVDLVVGRRSSVTKEILFDQNYEVIRPGADGLPAELIVTDHAGSFVDYESALDSRVAPYAQAVRRRRAFVADFAAFAEAYAAAFETRLAEIQSTYRARRKAFDDLFADRPFDTNGSGAYRWTCTLKNLDAADPKRLGALLREAIAC